MNSTVVIAMDGPSGSGKSSTAKGVANALGLRYLDTGAQFRALTIWLLDHDIDVEDTDAVTEAIVEAEIESGTDPLDPTITAAGVDVTEAIRSDRATASVSAVSTVPAARQKLLDLQRAIIGPGGIVVEGRDIGSVVWPEAELKLYLTADPAARAARRALESGTEDVAATQADLLRRDQIDSSRASAPLMVPQGAIHIDTTPHSLEEVIAKVVGLARAL